MNTHSHMDESHRHSVEEKTPDTKVYVWGWRSECLPVGMTDWEGEPGILGIQEGRES